jgi:Ni/Co efflux regulator RcnB
MKNTLIASALLALSVAASGNAFAQRGDHDNDRAQYSQHNAQHDDRRDNDRRDDRRDNDRRDQASNHRSDDARYYHRDDKRGGGPRHDLRRGQHLSKEYRDNRYVVTDWRNRHLSAPPKGHHWVRAGNDYVLAAIATGLIAQVLLSN